jgi:hypothetical protein
LKLNIYPFSNGICYACTVRAELPDGDWLVRRLYVVDSVRRQKYP